MERNTKWDQILSSWESGHAFQYPPNIPGQFYWRTNAYRGNNVFKEEFEETYNLQGKMDTETFATYFEQSDNKDVVAFMNLRKNTVLVAPMPRTRKSYAFIRDFTDNATRAQKSAFWKRVASAVRAVYSKHKCAYVSTHGGGVAYTHVRVSHIPMYYEGSCLR